MLRLLIKYQFLVVRSLVIFVNIGAVIAIKKFVGDEEATHLSLVLTLTQLLFVAAFYGGRIEVFKEQKADISAMIFAVIGLPLTLGLHYIFLTKYHLVGIHWEIAFVMGNSLLLFLAFYYRSLDSDWRSHICQLRLPVIVALAMMPIVDFSYQNFFKIASATSVLGSFIFLWSKIPLELIQVKNGVLRAKEFHNRRFFSQITSMLNYLYQNLDTLFVYYFFDVQTALLFYFLSRFAKLLTPVYQASNQYFMKIYAELSGLALKKAWYQNMKINAFISSVFLVVLVSGILVIEFKGLDSLLIERSQYPVVLLLFVSVVLQYVLGASGYLIMFSGKRIQNSIVAAIGVVAQILFLLIFGMDLTNVVASSVVSALAIVALHYYLIRFKVLRGYYVRKG